MHIQDRPIGVFDSGIGGLTVASALRRLLPSEEIVYLGDTARVPYGTKSVRAVNQYALECALFLLNRNVKMIVVACNTVSSVALPHLKETLRVPMIGVIDPGAAAAVKTSRRKRIGVIGTPATIASGAYQARVKALVPAAGIWGKACPLLVPMAEEGRVSGSVAIMVLGEYLRPLLSRKIDALILGCTHYPLFKSAIAEIAGSGVQLIDSADAVAAEVRAILLREGLLRTHGAGEMQCHVTDVPRQFDRLGRAFFGATLGRVSRVRLGEG